MPKTYDAAYGEFTKKYNLNGFDLMKEYEDNKQLNGIDDFSFDTTSQKKEQSTYLDTLTSALTAYLTEKTKMQSGKAYDMSDVSIVDFVKEFDKVMNAIRTDAAPEDKPYEHTPFANLSEGVMAGRAWQEVKHFNQSLSGIWGDQIRNGTLTLDDLENFTSKSTSMLDSMVQQNRNYTNVVKNDLANVVMAKNAMAAAINKRSWTSWLNPFNWGPNRRENNRLKELESKIEAYKTAGFPVDDVVPKEYTGKMLGKALSELKNTYQTEKQPTEKTQPALKPVEKKVKAEKKKPEPNKKKQPAKNKDVVGKVPTHEVAKELMKDNDAFSEQIFKVIGNYGDEFMRNVSKESTLYASRQRINNAWKDFKNADTEHEKKEAVQDIAIKTFKTLYNTVVANISSYSNSAVDQIVMTQKLTDFLLNNFSPIASNSKYAEYGNNYYVKNATPKEFLDNASLGGRYAGRSVEDAKKDLDNAKFELGMGKMSLPLDNEFSKKPTKTSEKIQNINAPTKDKHLDM